MKRRIAIMLVLVSLTMIVFTFGGCASAGSDDLTWTFDSATGKLTVSRTGAMINYYSDSVPWNVYCSSITAVEISDGVTIIGYGAFENCSKLTSIEIPSSVTSIGGSAFEGCSSLTSIEIPSSVTSIGDSAFSGCERLTSIEIPSSVTSIGYGVFEGCWNLTSIEIPSSVTGIGSRAFFGCSNLKYNEYDNGHYLGNAQNPYVALIDVKTNDITSCTIHEQTKVIGDNAFAGCRSLTSIEIPSSVTSIGDSAFSGCSNLTSIKVPSSVTSIGYYAFYGCSNLTSIEIPSSVTSIGSDAFENCSKLKYNEYGKGLYLGNAQNPYVALIEAKTTGITSCTIHEQTKVKSNCGSCVLWLQQSDKHRDSVECDEYRGLCVLALQQSHKHRDPVECNEHWKAGVLL